MFITFGIGGFDNKKLRALSFEIHSNVETAIYFANFTLNCLIFVDLFLTIKNPFKPRDQRLKYYILLVLFNSFICTFCFYHINSIKCPSVASCPENIFFDLLLVIIILLQVMVNYCLSCYIFRLLSREGTSKNLKNKVCRRHFVYLLLHTIFLFGYVANYY